LVADAQVEQAVRIAAEDPEALLAIVGPTASGKTELAIRVAERIGGEIIGADSVQIYQGFDIGSGKPTAAERARAPHHLIDILPPLDPADAARFASLANAAIDDVRARGKRPIVCGGTFLWVKALLFGLADAPAGGDAIRARHRAIAEAEGRPALHALLAAVDPVIAARLHPNDFVRVSRALEVHELTGEPMSAWQARHGFRAPRLSARVLALAVEPEELTRRITARVQAWLDRGWIEEVRALTNAGFGEARAMGSVGYREVRAFVAGERGERGERVSGASGTADPISRAQLEILIVRSTRIFARRQRTWLHHADVTWL
jgi:tRNA dimethylallyltransferase